MTLASTGSEAVEEVKARAHHEAFDLVLMDWRMPGLNGIDAARQIRQLCTEKPPVTILVTAYGREDVVRSAQSAGFQSVLSKPVNESLLFDAIANAFGSQPQAIAIPMGNGPILFPGQPVLLVEDNEVNQQVARELLEQSGLTVTIANHGREAVDLLRESSFEVILMDVQMPVMDGLTATRLIRKEGLAPKTPIVAMTANAMAGDRDLCIDAGMDDYVAKPIEPEELMATLSRYLRTATDLHGPTLHATGGDWEFPIVHGLDPKAGLRRVAYNAGLYRKLLLQFQREQGGSALDLRAALNLGDHDKATRIVHNLKGVAANLGAVLVASQAGALEKRLRSTSVAELEGPLGLLERTMDRLCHELKVLQADPEVEKRGTEPVDPNAVAIEVEAIRPLLESDLEQAMEQADSLVARYAQMGGPLGDLLRKLQDALQSFDTDTAGQLLDEMKERVTASGEAESSHR